MWPSWLNELSRLVHAAPRGTAENFTLTRQKAVILGMHFEVGVLGTSLNSLKGLATLKLTPRDRMAWMCSL